MEGGVGIRAEESEESSAETKGMDFRQIKEREGVEYCLPSVDGQKDQGLVPIYTASNLSHFTTWSRLFSSLSDFLSLNFPSKAGS